jgi:hypothetical protein
MSAFMFDATRVTPSISFHPAPGSPWRVIDEAPPVTSTLTLSRFTAINPTRLSKAFALKGGNLIKQPGGNPDRRNR